jgi:tether containing UBX domain for GLUT4
VCYNCYIVSTLFSRLCLLSRQHGVSRRHRRSPSSQSQDPDYSGHSSERCPPAGLREARLDRGAVHSQVRTMKFGSRWIHVLTFPRYNKKAVDLSRPFRLSGLPSGAQLELVQSSRSPSVVTVALQLPQSGSGPARLTHKFPSSTSIWQILRQFESGVASESNGVLIITQRGIPVAQSGSEGSGRLYYEMPTVNIMNRELTQFVDLQKTLAQLGVTSGNVLLRLHYKNSGLPMEEAIQQISQYFKSTEIETETVTAAAHGTQAAGVGVLQSKPTSSSTPQEEEIMAQPVEDVAPALSMSTKTPPDEATGPDIATPNIPLDPANPEISSSAPVPDSPAATEQSEPSMKVYTAPNSSTPLAAEQGFNDSDYEPTIDHARTHQARLTADSRNRRLPSDAELEARESTRLAKLAQVTTVRVRIRLPDQTMLETSFGKSAVGADVYGLVRNSLLHPDAPFVLRYVDNSGAHVALPETAALLIAKIGWRGSVLVSMAWLDGAAIEVRRAPALKADVLATARQLPVAEPDADALLKDKDREKQGGGGFLGALRDGKDSLKERLSGSEKEAKLAKFLRFGKK